MENDNKQYPEGYFIRLGLVLGIPLGLPFSITLDNPGFIGIGLPIGLAIGVAMEAKYKNEGKIRPLTEEENKIRKIGVTAGIAIAILLLGIFLLKFLF